jgi:uncharacterized RmlC-like cupin family protein
LTEHLVVRAGEFPHLPANVPHLPYNPNPDTARVALLARTDPNEQESVVLYDGPREGPKREDPPPPAAR